jgi:hypothetical protein
VSEHTLQLLKQLKEHMQKGSYDEAIHTLTIEKIAPSTSMAGSIKKYIKHKSLNQILREMKEDRKKDD